jgi:glycine C-acetyltransferase
MTLNIFDGSTRVRALNKLNQWLTQSGNKQVWSRVCSGVPGRTVTARLSHGDHPDLPQIHFGSYNYSGLNDRQEVVDAAREALERHGATTSGVRILNGTTGLHLKLEEVLARFTCFESCVTYSSAYVANLAVISTLAGETDVIYSDELNHASIADGIRLSRAKQVKYSHKDVAQLEGLLRSSPLSDRKFIITDGVFSMDGDFAPLPKIVELAKKYRAFVIVDDAHGTASCGPNGRGTLAHFGLEKEVDVLIGSLSKGLPGIGGFACASQEIGELLRYGSNGYIFSASIPPSVAGGLIRAVEILESEPDIQLRLHRNEQQIRDGLREAGFDVMHSETPIIPLAMPDRATAFNFARGMHERGVFVNPICYPAVAMNRARIRVNASASLTDADIASALITFSEVGRSVGLI